MCGDLARILTETQPALLPNDPLRDKSLFNLRPWGKHNVLAVGVEVQLVIVFDDILPG